MTKQSRLDCLIVLPSLGSGGTEKNVVMLSKYLSQHRSVGVATFSSIDEDFFHIDETVLRISIGIFKNSSSIVDAISHNAKRIVALRKILKKYRPSSIISFLPQSNIISLISSVGLNCRVIVSERNSIRDQNLSVFWRLARKISYRHSTYVTVNSDALKKEVFREIGCQAVKVPNLIEVPELLELPCSREKLVLSVGRIVKQKGFDLLLKGFALTRARTNGWKLCIVGDGPILLDLQILAKDLELANSVIWVGVTEDVQSWYKKSKLFILVSRYEGTSNAMLEAMSWGLPVIVSNTSGGAIEIIKDGENGIIVNLDALDIANKIDRIVENKSLAESVGRFGRRTAEMYQINSAGTGWIELIDGTIC